MPVLKGFRTLLDAYCSYDGMHTIIDKRDWMLTVVNTNR